MKLLLLSLIFSQSVSNFSIENGSVIWQKSYPTTLTFDQFVNEFNKSGLLESFTVNGSVITGTVNNLEAKYKEAGYSTLNISTYLSRCFVKGFVVIEHKDSSYLVTVKKILFEQRYTDGLSRQGEKFTIEYAALTNDKTDFRKFFINRDSKVLDLTFLNTFMLPE